MHYIDKLFQSFAKFSLPFYIIEWFDMKPCSSPVYKIKWIICIANIQCLNIGAWLMTLFFSSFLIENYAHIQLLFIFPANLFYVCFYK